MLEWVEDAFGIGISDRHIPVGLLGFGFPVGAHEYIRGREGSSLVNVCRHRFISVGSFG